MATPDKDLAADLIAKDRRINELLRKQDQLLRELTATSDQLRERLSTAVAEAKKEKYGNSTARADVNVEIHLEDPSDKRD